MEKTASITFNLKIEVIKVSKFQLYDLDKLFDKQAFPLLEFQTSFNFNVFEKEDKIKSTILVKMNIIETKELFGELYVETTFKVNPIDKVIIAKEENKVEINKDVITNLASISYSTVRGILYEKLKGTIAQKEIYPLLNLKKIFDKKEK